MGNRGGEPAYLEILRFPVVDQGLIDLAQQIVLIGVDAVQFPIGRFTQPSLRMAEISRQFLARHRLPLAADGERKREAVRDDVVQ
jgi:hypothetical protein